MQSRRKVEKRNVVLKIETYERLDRWKIKLIIEKGDSRITFDDVINYLCDVARVDDRDAKFIPQSSAPA